MKRILSFAVAAAALLTLSCSKGGGQKMRTSTDSVAYVIGMNVGYNLLRMDSTLNVAAVCQAIRDVYDGRTLLTPDEAETFYLRYVYYEQPEKIRAYEEQFLEDIRRSNRSYARTSSGLTYTVEAIGDEANTASADRDTVSVRLLGRTADGREFLSSYERGDTLRAAMGDLLPGIRESVKLVGEGGKVHAWVPAAAAYGAQGDDSLAIRPNATLYYEIEVVKVEKVGKNVSRR